MRAVIFENKIGSISEARVTISRDEKSRKVPTSVPREHVITVHYVTAYKEIGRLLLLLSILVGAPVYWFVFQADAGVCATPFVFAAILGWIYKDGIPGVRIMTTGGEILGMFGLRDRREVVEFVSAFEELLGWEVSNHTKLDRHAVPSDVEEKSGGIQAKGRRRAAFAEEGGGVATGGRPMGITVLAIYHWFVAAALSVWFLFTSMLTVFPRIAEGGDGSLAIGMFISLLSVGTAIIFGIVGWGLWQLRPWTRVGAIVLAILQLLAFPIGTIIGALTLWYLLTDPDAKAAFQVALE